MAKSSPTGPDHLLAEEQFPELNQTFYQSTPYDYFDQRLRMLVLYAGRSADIGQLMEEGVAYGKLHLRQSENDDKNSERTRQRREQYVVTEIEVLYHHVIESLLRLFLAHEPELQTDGSLECPPCPWLAVARLRSFSEFKDRVRTYFLEPGDELLRRKKISKLFYGYSSYGKELQRALSVEQWEESVSRIMTFLTNFTDHYLDMANLYNAAKHGFAVMPGETAMKFADGTLLSVSGPSIEYLETRAVDADSGAKWHHTIAWVDVERTMILTHVAARLIEMLWTIARLSYIGQEKEESVWLFNPPPFDKIVETKPIQVKSMHISLQYYNAP
jgi:hypothetical protein